MYEYSAVENAHKFMTLGDFPFANKTFSSPKKIFLLSDITQCKKWKWKIFMSREAELCFVRK